MWAWSPMGISRDLAPFTVFTFEEEIQWLKAAPWEIIPQT